MALGAPTPSALPALTRHGEAELVGGRLPQARRLEGRLLTLRPGIPPAEPLRLGDRPASTLPLRGGGGERQSPGMAQSSRAGWAGFPQEQARDQPGRLPVETEQSEIWELAACKRPVGGVQPKSPSRTWGAVAQTPSPLLGPCSRVPPTLDRSPGTPSCSWLP